MDNTMPMYLYAHEHMMLTGEYIKGMRHHDVSEFTTKKEKKS